jgi:Tol biopolymer transport system component
VGPEDRWDPDDLHAPGRGGRLRDPRGGRDGRLLRAGGADRVVAAGATDAARRLATPPRVPARRRGTVLAALASVIVLALAVGVVALRADDGASPARVGTVPGSTAPVPPSTTLPPPSATIPAGLLGRVAWIDGDVLVTASPSHPRPRVIAKGQGTNPKWSPDGRWLAYTRAEGLHVVTASGTQVQLILTKDDYEWSPQGDSIAWTDGQLRVTDIATGIETTVVTKSNVSGFAWSPDGGELAVASFDPGGPTRGFDVVDVAAGTRRTVAFAPADDPPGVNPLLFAGWQPDGNAVLVWVDEYGSGSIAQDGLDLWLIPLDGSAPHNLGQTLVKRSWIRWSPDGTRLAIVRSKGRDVISERAVAICTSDGSCTPITGPDVLAFDPSWSPDGRKLAYVREPAGQQPVMRGNDHPDWAARYATRRLWVADADGANAEPMTTAAGGVASPSWSADGKQILYLRDAALWSLDLRNARVTRLVAPIVPVAVMDTNYGYQTNLAPPDAVYEPTAANGFPTWESLVSWSR